MDLELFIEDFIGRYLDDPNTNNLGDDFAEKAWGDFLVGYSNGADPLYAWSKLHIGPFHWTPLEAFTLAHPATPAVAEDLTVVSFALCQTEATKAANRAETYYPSERWARNRVFGQECSRNLHVALVAALEAAGYPAVAPFFLPQWGDRTSDRFGRASNWSERHAAYISGLGTFGLSGGMITKKGQAVRLGSVIVQGYVPPTPRSYSGPFAYCLYFVNGTCGDCADRCPSGSISRSGRNKEACASHLDHAVAEHVCSRFGFTGYGCGLCQTGVPCESGIPAPLTESS